MIATTRSATLDQPVAAVWALIRDFNNYPAYIEGVSESVIEDDRPGDAVGAVRRFCYGGSWLRQRLAEHSDEARRIVYEGMEPFALSAADAPEPAPYRGIMQLRETDDGARTAIDWTVEVDAKEADAEAWRTAVAPLIEGWIASLRRTLDRLGAAGAAA